MEADHEQQIHYLNSGRFIPLRREKWGASKEGDKEPPREGRAGKLLWGDSMQPPREGRAEKLLWGEQMQPPQEGRAGKLLWGE